MRSILSAAMQLTTLINKPTRSIVLVLLLAVAAIGALLLLMGQMAPQKTTSSTPQAVETPTLSVPNNPTATSIDAGSEDTVATVNNTIITRQTWQQATRLDALMSRLAGQPIPTAEETLDRLVNEIIVLDAAGPITPASNPEIENKIASLTQAWNITEPAMANALAKAGLGRTDLANRVSRLLQVESALNQLAAQHPDLNAWLVQARASAEIGLYRSLVAAAPTTLPPMAAPQNPPVPTPASSPIFAPPAGMPIFPYPENAAPDFTLNQLNGQPLSLSDFRGKPAIINFWATWCPPCRSELPALQAAYNARSNEIGFVAVDVKENAETVSAFVNELGLTFPVVVDSDGSVSDVSYQVRGLPTTLFVDANGVVAARHVGPLDESAIENYLAPLLAAAPGQNGAPTTANNSDLPAQGVVVEQPSGTPATDDFTFASNFSLTAASGAIVSLQDYQDKRSVVLVFYRGHT